MRVPINRLVAGRVLVGVAAVGALASLLGTVVGVRMLGELRGALDQSIGVTAEAVDALHSSVEVGGEALVAVQAVLEETAATTRRLTPALRDAEQALDGVAELSENQIADTLDAVDGGLPALIDVAAVIDRTLSALQILPFGPDYAPPEPFDDSLRTIRRQMQGLPEDLRRQAELIREGGDSLAEVRRGTSRLAGDLDRLHMTLGTAAEILDDYADTAEDAEELVTGSHERLRRQLGFGRVLVVVLGGVFLLGQAVPAALGWFLLDPEAVTALLAAPGPSDGDR